MIWSIVFVSVWCNIQEALLKFGFYSGEEDMEFFSFSSELVVLSTLGKLVLFSITIFEL